MFRVDRSNNQLNKLVETGFSKQGIRERQDLQEWLVKTPDAMGEDLLIIQKEFDGFGNSRKRLDLLALDTGKRLVVIENKLDDSGQDVIWQALQYTASVANLTTKGIISIYQKYLNKFYEGEDALRNIREFLGMEEREEDEIGLNPDNSQRLFLIAKNFRADVTNTVLWLRKRGIDARCFTIKPYTIDDADREKEILLDIRCIIPQPDLEDLMVHMDENESEAKKAQGDAQKRFDYWKKTLDALSKEGITLYQNKSPSYASWLAVGAGLSRCYYRLIFSKEEIRVEFALHRRNAEENKNLFDGLHSRKEKIEKAFGEDLHWLRLDNQKSSQIQFGCPCDSYDREKWPKYIEWHVRHIKKLENAIKPEFKELSKNAKK